MFLLDENTLSLQDQTVVVPLDLVCAPVGGEQLSRWLKVYISNCIHISQCRIIARAEIKRSIKASRPDLGRRMRQQQHICQER